MPEGIRSEKEAEETGRSGRKRENPGAGSGADRKNDFSNRVKSFIMAASMSFKHNISF